MIRFREKGKVSVMKRYTDIWVDHKIFFTTRKSYAALQEEPDKP